MKHSSWLGWLVAVSALTLMVSCGGSKLPNLKPVERVDLERFMGDWYVIANIPTRFEQGAHNAVESYRLGEDGDVVETTFTFREDAFDGPLKEYNPTGYVRDGTGNAIWGMQFIWPFKSDYRVIWLDHDYQVTVIGRQARDYVWVMAREPRIDQPTMNEIRRFLAAEGYELSQLQTVPQRWTD